MQPSFKNNNFLSEKNSKESFREKTLRIYTLPLAMVFLVLASSFILRTELQERENQVIANLARQEAAELSNTLAKLINQQVIALQRMAQRWEANHGTEKANWQKDATNYVMDMEGLTTVEWVDKTYHVRWVEPLKGNEKALGLNIVFDEARKKALDGAAKQGRITITPPLDLVQGYKAFIAYTPIYLKGEFDGFIVGIFSIDKTMATTLTDNVDKDFSISLRSEGKTFYESKAEKKFASLAVQTDIKIFDKTWQLKISPSASFVKRNQTRLPELVLISGVMLSLLAGLSLYYAIIAHRQTQRLAVQSKDLEQNEAFLQLILQSAGAGIYGLDTEGKTTFANKAAIDILGYTLEEMQNVSQHELIHHTYPDGTPYRREDCNIYKAFKDGQTHSEDKEVFWNKEGRPVPVEYTSHPIHDMSGNIAGAVVMFTDITERKQSEKALLNLNTELEEFAYRTSHDLRSPIVSSLALLSMADTALEKNNTERARESIVHVADSLKKLKELIESILILTEAKNKSEKKQPIDVALLIEESLDKLAHMEGFARLDIQKDFQFKGSVLAKEMRLRLIVENLISNAVKYSDPKKKDSFIRISVYTEGNDLSLEVTDNGLGIPKDQQDQLFEMFKRFHPKVSYGSGLGMYLMKKSADILGGSIEFEDLDGCSKFTLKIPIQQKDD